VQKFSLSQKIITVLLSYVPLALITIPNYSLGNLDFLHKHIIERGAFEKQKIIFHNVIVI